MDIQALLNSVASGPPPAIPTGVNRVPVPQINLPGIGQVPVPQVPVDTSQPVAPVVPGQPLPTAQNPYGVTGPAAQRLSGLGNVIGQPGPPSVYQPTALGTMQIPGPRGDRTLVSNLAVPMNVRSQQLKAQNFFKQAAAAQGQPQQAPTPIQQHMAASTGYTGGFAPGQYEGWLSAQPPAIRQAAHTAFGQAAMAAPPSPPPSQHLGSLLAPRAGAMAKQQPSAAARYNRWR